MIEDESQIYAEILQKWDKFIDDLIFFSCGILLCE